MYYALVALIGVGVVGALQRFHRSPIGSVLVAIRENEQRAQFVGYPTQRYKQIAFTISATLCGFAGVLSVFHHRFASADPTAVTFSGELLAMVIIGGMRSLLGPGARARCSTSCSASSCRSGRRTGCCSSACCSSASSSIRRPGSSACGGASPSRCGRRSSRRRRWRAAGSSRDCRCRRSCSTTTSADGAALEARDLAKSFGGIQAVVDAGFAVRPRTLHALIGPNGAGKTTVFNLISGMFAPDRGSVTLAGASDHRTRAASHGCGGTRALVPDHEPVLRRVDRGERAPRRAGARSVAFQRLVRCAVDRARDDAHGGADPFPRPDRHRARRCRHAVVRRPAAARHGTGARVRSARAAARRAARGTGRRRARARRAI